MLQISRIDIFKLCYILINPLLCCFFTGVSALSSEMDSPNSNLTCAICLERFRIPVTIPCGHTFCQTCISTYWDTTSKSDVGPQCPICSEKFDTRPILKRNVSLSVLTEAANSTGPSCRESLMRGSEGARAMLLCDRHKKPLVYYCRQDRTSVCYECGISECENHEKVLLEAERENQEVVTKYHHKSGTCSVRTLTPASHVIVTVSS